MEAAETLEERRTIAAESPALRAFLEARAQQLGDQIAVDQRSRFRLVEGGSDA
jgi:hypothetical protein